MKIFGITLNNKTNKMLAFGCLFELVICGLFLLLPCLQSIKEIFLVVYYLFFLLFLGISFFVPFKLSNILNNFKNSQDKNIENLFDSEKTSKGVWDIYKSTFFNTSSGRKCTMAESDLYFNTDSVMSYEAPVMIKFFHQISESFIGIGILGTFLGFAIGMKNIDFSNVDNMVLNIETLIHSGFATAFNTSIVGISCSIVYKFFIYIPQIAEMDKCFSELSDDLDNRFYISNIEVMDRFNSDLAENLARRIDETFNINIKNFGDMLIRAINEEIISMKSALSEATNKINSVIISLTNTPTLLEVAYKKIESESDKLIDKFNSSVNMFTPKIEYLKEAIDSSLSEIQTIGQTYEKVSINVDDIYNKLIDTYQEADKQIKDIFTNIQGNHQSFVDMDKAIQEQIAFNAEHIKNLVENENKNQEIIKSINDAISKTERLLQGFTEVDKSLDSIFKKLNDTIRDYLVKVEDTYRRAINASSPNR